MILAGSDLVLDSGRWTTCIVGKLSPWLQLDSDDPGLRIESEAALRQELQWASHLGVPAVLAPPPSGATGSGPLSSSNYGAHLNQILEASSLLHIWMKAPLSGTAAVADDDGSTSGGDDGNLNSSSSNSGSAPCPLSDRSKRDPWEGWNALRQHAEGHPRLSVALEIGPDLPPPAFVARWAGEPVKAAILPTSVFLTNRAGFPTLSKPHQQLVAFLAQYKVQFLLKGRPRVSGGHGAYLQYLNHICGKLAPAFSPSFMHPGSTPASAYIALTSAAEAAAAGAGASSGPGVIASALESLSERRMDADDWEALSGYLDVLQAPLQPLADNLESQTYETFERDPVKYEQYEAAIASALLDRPQGSTTVIWVVGAGRGPLVRRALSAADSTKRTVRVYAVEKNPNAVIT